MARLEVSLSLEQLRSATSIDQQIFALKQLKNDIIGHEQRKEAIIRHGAIELLVKGLEGSASGPASFSGAAVTAGKARGKKRSSRHGAGAVEDGMWAGGWDMEDEVKLQSVYIITSLAHGGNDFIAPLIAGGVIPPLLANLSPSQTPPQMVVGTLRALAVMAESLSKDLMVDYLAMRDLLGEQLFSRPTIDCLAQILAQGEVSQVVNEQLSLVMQIVRFSLADSPKHRTALVSAGVLDLLASRLVSWIVVTRPVFRPLDPQLLETFLPPPSRASYSSLLEALAAIVRGSAYRGARLFYSRDICFVFPTLPTFPPNPDPQASFTDSSSSPVASASPYAWDRLLPQLTPVQNKTELSFSKSFPALGSFASSTAEVAVSRTKPLDELKCDLVAWLIHMIRTTTSEERLSTIWLLAVLLNATDLNVQCERSISLLVVPPLVRMIGEVQPRPSKDRMKALPWADYARVQAPMALSLLIENSPTLQKAAVDAEAIKVLCPILKKSFDPVTTTKKVMWSPYPKSSIPDPTSSSDFCLLGPPSMPSELLHALSCRASVMTAIAAVAQKEERTRKEIINSGVVGCLADALVPYPDGPLPSTHSKSPESIDTKGGNPTFVLTAALHVLTTLSRSVSILRTSLIDGDIARPVFELLKHDSLEVKRAATDALVNLILHFSPMREELMNAGVLPILCEHAHSPDMELRVSALWALKHLITQASRDIRLQAFKALSPGFLTQILTSDSGISAVSQHKTHLATPNALGEKVDLLNAVDEPATMDIDIGANLSSDDEPTEVMDDPQRRKIRQKYALPLEYAERLRPIRRAEQSPALRARRDDVRMQHHALDFLRNMLAEPSAQQQDMVDTVLAAIGTTHFFEIVVSKLKARSPASSSGHLHASPGGGGGSGSGSGPGSTAGKRPTLTTPGGTTGNAAKQSYIDPALYSHPDILHSALFILVHVGNGRPAHRHLVLSQPQLLSTLLPLFAHPEARIRVACVWLVHNVLWLEDENDTAAARQRAMELRVAGVEDKCRDALRDSDLDTRERAKAVHDVFGKLLEGAASGGAGAGAGGGSGGSGGASGGTSGSSGSSSSARAGVWAER